MSEEEVIFDGSEETREDHTITPQHPNYKQVIWDGRNGGLQQ